MFIFIIISSAVIEIRIQIQSSTRRNKVFESKLNSNAKYVSTSDCILNSATNIVLRNDFGALI